MAKKAKPTTTSNDTTEDQPWYREGLRFQCTGCGDCCTGAPGYVWLNNADIRAMADEVSLNVEEFEKRYVRSVGVRKSLIEYENGDCVFFDNKSRGCTVYGARPRQCRTWPFWDSNLKSPQAWAETCEACPGSGKGKLYQLEAIETQRAVIKV
ncbi:MAG: YkgJ family cysteine cluster protein [Planctomycetota bacterium]